MEIHSIAFLFAKNGHLIGLINVDFPLPVNVTYFDIKYKLAGTNLEFSKLDKDYITLGFNYEEV